MGFTSCRIRERLAAVPAAERLFSGVNTYVPLEITCVGEFLPTVLKKTKQKKQRLNQYNLEMLSHAGKLHFHDLTSPTFANLKSFLPTNTISHLTFVYQRAVRL